MTAKKELEQNTLVCAQMIFWRTLCIVASIPFFFQMWLSMSNGLLLRSQWPIVLLCIPLLPLLYYMFRLVVKTHGFVTASFHILLTVALTPFLLAGPLLIPLLVRGDARRLLIVQNNKT